MVLAPNAFARDNAAALRSFIAASVEGWRDYLHGDSRAADALIRKANPDATQPLLDAAKQALRENAIVDGGDAALTGLGAMSAERWRLFHEAASTAAVYPADLNWRDAFTDAYLPGRG
jgi:NitT/TauT family transport system substrate-binding protein